MAKPIRRNGRGFTLAAVPGLLVSFLPCVTCPGCWPLYAGVLSSLGLGALLDRAWLLPVAIVALGLAVFGLAFRAPRRRGYAPAIAGIVASVTILVGKFLVGSDAVTYSGAIVLGAATAWNAWPARRAAGCVACVPGRECAR